MPEWLHIAWRSLLILTVLFVLTRLLGKKQITHLNFFQYIIGITIGSIAAEMSSGLEASLVLGFTALLVWTLVPMGLEYLTLKSKLLRDVIEGKGTVLIKDGKVLEDNMKKERYSTDDLMEKLRQKNTFKVADVEFAVLESDGNLSVMLKTENQPLTPKHLGIQVGPEQEPQSVIYDGKIMDEPLATIGLNRGWLNTELEKMGIALENVFIGQVDTYGQLYVDLYDDQIKVPEPQQTKLLYATLKKIEADFELFALSTKDNDAKTMYSRSAGKMNRLVKQLTPLLKRS